MSATFSFWLRRVLVGLLLSAPLLGGCTGKSANDAVSVTALNYTGKELSSFLFIDPQDENKVAGGPPLTPYSGAGTLCCYSLPHRWKPGIKVKLSYKWFYDDDKPRDREVLTVDIPPYPTDEPGMLWALFYEDGSVQVVASAVDPGHPKWPGKVKTWPVPSREYRLKLWQMDYDEIASGIPYEEQMVLGLSPAELEKAWETRAKYSRDSIKGFAGPTDPRFRDALKKEGIESLQRSRERLSALEKNKP